MKPIIYTYKSFSCIIWDRLWHYLIITIILFSLVAHGDGNVKGLESRQN
jgi:hypothetical protein